MKINANRENHSFYNIFHAKSMKILPQNLFKIIKINEKSMKIHGNFIRNHRKFMKIIRKSIIITENH